MNEKLELDIVKFGVHTYQYTYTSCVLVNIRRYCDYANLSGYIRTKVTVILR